MLTKRKLRELTIGSTFRYLLNGQPMLTLAPQMLVSHDAGRPIIMNCATGHTFVGFPDEEVQVTGAFVWFAEI